MTNAKVIYLDSSAIVKLIIAEPESLILRKFVDGYSNHASCALARVEVIRAVTPHGEVAISRARDILDRLSMVHVDNTLLDEAALLPPEILRSLDAIHLAAAIALENSLDTVVTYDECMANACKVLSLPQVAPS